MLDNIKPIVANRQSGASPIISHETETIIGLAINNLFLPKISPIAPPIGEINTKTKVDRENIIPITSGEAFNSSKYVEVNCPKLITFTKKRETKSSNNFY